MGWLACKRANGPIAKAVGEEEGILLVANVLRKERE